MRTVIPFRRTWLLIIASLVLSLSLCIHAQDVTTGWLTNPNHPPVKVRFILTGQVDKENREVEGFLEVKLENDWKTYWRSPGEAGISPEIDWGKSNNIDNVKWHWPSPDRFSILGIETLGYKGNVIFPMTIKVKNYDRPVDLHGKLTLSTCTTVCVLTDYQIKLSFDTSKLIPSVEAIHLYNLGYSQVPKASSDISDVRMGWNSDTETLSLTMTRNNKWINPVILIDGEGEVLSDIVFSKPKLHIDGNKLNATLSATSWISTLDLLGKQLQITIIDHNFIAEQSAIVGSPLPIQVEHGSIGRMILFAIVGGLILNIMPCVLPVLGMKLRTVIFAQGLEKRQIRLQFLASAAGIFTSFWLIALFLTVLKVTGSAIGWGIQFQSPYFIGFMALITMLFGANMLGIFEIFLPTKANTWLATRGDNSYSGNFLQGMFATLLATPCSAPFLGTAVAFALATNIPTLFAIFTALGFGMALPWLTISFIPRLANALPKPGPWMNKVKLLFGLMMLATSVWLLFLLTNYLPVYVILSIILIPIIFAIYRMKLSIFGKKNKLQNNVCLLLLLVPALVIIATITVNLSKPLRDDLHWEPLSLKRINEAVTTGKTVFVDVTADWCITCSANKARVILQEPVYSSLKQPNIVLLRGDWTKPSDKITAYLQSHDRYGVPFNIVYGPEAPIGIPLPTILSDEVVMSALKKSQ